MWRQNLFEALAAIRANRLRAVLTILIIAFGILAMVGVLTSIDGIKHWMRSSFSTLGANTFIVQNRASMVRIGGRTREEPHPPIRLSEAQRLKERLPGTCVASLSLPLRFDAQAKVGQRETHSNLRLTGADENVLTVESYAVAHGRGLSAEDVAGNRQVALIGHRVAQDLFPEGGAVGRHLFVGRKRYTVVGVLAEKGTAFGSPGDRVIFLPITTALADFPATGEGSVALSVFVDRPELMPLLREVATAEFRLVRGLLPGEANNFATVVSDSFVQNLLDNLAILTIAATLIAIITLLGAAIGLMNILLVSVTERTREIGLRKALGATPRTILFQFLTEAVVIGQLGGLLGIALGLAVGNLVGSFLDAPFLAPWPWIVLGVGVCLVVGLVAGLYPARKAARLDPIDALRFE